MVKNVFLAPGSKEHMNRSVLPVETLEDVSKLQNIEGIIPIDNLKDVLRSAEEAELRRIYPDGRVRLWGAKPSLKNVWDQLENGDYVLFYNRNYFIGVAEAVFKTVNTGLATKVWGEDKSGETWENVFFVNNVRKLNLHRKTFNKVAGYSENFVPQGFMKVGREEAKKRILESIVSPSEQKIVIPPEAEEFIEKFKADPENKAWLERKIVAFEKWRKAFSPENIDKLSRENFRSFLGIKENQSWDGIQRQPNVYADMNKLRRTIKYLVDGVDTSTPQDVQKRLDTILERDAEYEITGLKRAIVTPILHICDTKNRFGVWNSKVDRAFEKLGLPALKPKASPGERYIAYNNALNLIGKQYDLNLYEVDILLHKIATEYTPGTGEIMPHPFAFTSKDFESCTGKPEDAKYLSKRFKDLLAVLKPALGDEFATFTSYSARPSKRPKAGQKKVEYRDHMWLGFVHRRVERPLAFQVAINSIAGPFCIHIFIDRRAPKSRERARENAENKKATFKELLQSLATGYSIALLEGYKFDKKTTELTPETIEEFVRHMADRDTYVHIGRVLSREEVLSAGPKIVDIIVNTINELYPTYSLLVGQPGIVIKKIPSIDRVISYIASKGFFYPKETIKNYHTSLETKPFVILSGITGIGKTKLTELYANGFHGVDQENKYYKKIPVQPNWNDKKPLLGYYNPIMETYYKTPFLDFLLKALEDCQSCDFNVDGRCTDRSKCTRKYFVCLDEMNLAHVEYYFADFLSAMESDNKQIDLHSTKVKTGDGKELGPKIGIPDNLYVAGTVNIDETTKEFSPKVLDRANTIYLDVVDLDKWLEVQASRGRSVDYDAFRVIKEIHEVLKKHGMHFGYRVCNEIIEYVEHSILPKQRALDLQIMQKILPKLSGDDNTRLRGSLQDLKAYLENKPYTSSKNKVKNMLDKLEQQGFTSFFD